MLLLNGLSGGQIGPWRADLPGITDGCVGWDKDQTNADDWCEFSSASNSTVFLVNPLSTLHIPHSLLPNPYPSIRSYSDQHGSCREFCLVAAYFCFFLSMLVNDERALYFPVTHTHEGMYQSFPFFCFALYVRISAP